MGPALAIRYSRISAKRGVECILSLVVHSYFPCCSFQKWDICAGDALISAVGGKMTTLKGDFIDYSYDLTKAKQINDDKLVVALKDKHDEYRSKLEAGLQENDKSMYN